MNIKQKMKFIPSTRQSAQSPAC